MPRRVMLQFQTLDSYEKKSLATSHHMQAVPFETNPKKILML